MTISVELAIALANEDRNNMAPNYAKAPGMTKQVLKMRNELPHWFDADARTVLEYLKR